MKMFRSTNDIEGTEVPNSKVPIKVRIDRIISKTDPKEIAADTLRVARYLEFNPEDTRMFKLKVMEALINASLYQTAVRVRRELNLTVDDLSANPNVARGFVIGFAKIGRLQDADNVAARLRIPNEELQQIKAKYASKLRSGTNTDQP